MSKKLKIKCDGVSDHPRILGAGALTGPMLFCELAEKNYIFQEVKKMGQRLVFKCVKEGKTFATLYFHWSAYTESTYEEAMKIVEGLRARGYSSDMSIPDTQKLLVAVLHEDFYEPERTIGHNGNDIHIEARRGGVNYLTADVEAFRELGLDKALLYDEEVNRSNGLISISQKGMQEAIYWAEDLEEINFDDETVTNYNFSRFKREEDPEEFDDIFEGSDLDIGNPPLWDPPKGYTGIISWNDIRLAYEWFRNTYGSCGNPSYVWILGRDSDGAIVTQVC